ncbi:MAG: ATP phosphoribosyltransferase regulatory subunit [Rhodospirillaceae bacterium]|nr:ATP phosphoribosyltransferase regulatory subunit [Rhodospirillaceae bacterium]
MTETLPHWALLPDGLHDLLPPQAAHEVDVVEHLMALLESHGYERVKPPLLEFEETLLGGVGAALANETFRLMDPISQRMMALRADMTVQIARLALARLSKAPRPLRLAYSGQVLRVRGSQLRPERQFAQVGAELIGAPTPYADAEIAALAAMALDSIGVNDLSLDLTVPSLVPIILDAMAVPAAQRPPLRQALERKDEAAIRTHGGAAADLLCRLAQSSGPAEHAMALLARLPIPEQAFSKIKRLEVVLEILGRRIPDTTLTIDLVEYRGLEYQRGVSFTAFARGARGELGRGGHYLAGNHLGEGVPATGFTLFMDSVLRCVAEPQRRRRVYVPLDSEPAKSAELRAAGWVTVAALDAAEPMAEAARLGCDMVLAGDHLVAVQPPPSQQEPA